MKKILNIVMCRKDEDFKGLMDFLDMMKSQRKVEMDEIQITVVQLGEEQKTSLDDRNALGILGTVYKGLNIDVIYAKCGSIAEIYNQRILKSDEPWILFMDYGDFFPDVYSLSMIMNLLPSDEFDILWTERYDEASGDDPWINVIREADREIHGKLFRRKFLMDNRIFFDETVRHDEGVVFLQTAMSMTDYSRFAKVSTKFIPYDHTVQIKDDKETPDGIVERVHETNMAVIRNIRRRGDIYMQAVMHAICDGYFIAHMKPVGKVKSRIMKEIRKVCVDNRTMIGRLKPEDTEIFLDEAQEEMLSVCNNAFMQHGIEMYYEEGNDTFDKWLAEGCRVRDGKTEPVAVHVPKDDGKEDRVAVFCGTRNVYENMETAAKSLMYHTKMDRVYFLIEDDKFPNPLPENIICMNVSGQKWFDPRGLNYRNAWTYMCLMRAAFAKLMPDEHKVLSLDIDVVINDDISELWDIDLKGYYFAGVPEIEKTGKDKVVYANFGVIMMNLDMIRETKIDDTIIHSLNRDKWACPEQDAFNHFCKGKIMALPPKYNATRAGHITAETEEEKISHYAGIKYWKQFAPVRKYAGMSWDEVMSGSGD